MAPLAIALSLWVLSARAAQTDMDPELIKKAAYQSAKACQWSRAIFWSRLLGEADRDFALLYRMSWLQSPKQSSPASDKAWDTEKEWAWKWDGEFWKDEHETLITGADCAGRESVPLVSFPQEVLTNTVAPYLKNYGTHSKEARQVTRAYLFHTRLTEAQDLPEIPQPPAAAEKIETCELRALGILDKKNVEALDAYYSECPGVLSGSLGAHFDIAAGDIYIKNGYAEKAYPLFKNSISNVPEKEVTPKLWYRLAIAAMLSNSEDDQFFRASYFVVGAPEKGLEPLYKGTARNLMCEKVQGYDPVKATGLFKKIFKKETWLAQARELLEACPTGKLEGHWRALLPHAQNTHDRLELLGKNLEISVQQGLDQLAVSHLRELLKLSPKLPFAVSRAIWQALNQHRGALPQKIVSSYRASGHWQENDDQKWTRWKAEPRKAKEEKSLQTDTFAEGEALKLPVAVEMPKLDITGQFRVSFLALMEEALQ